MYADHVTNALFYPCYLYYRSVLEFTVAWLLQAWLDAGCHVIVSSVIPSILPVERRAMEKLEKSTSPMPPTSKLANKITPPTLHVSVKSTVK